MLATNATYYYHFSGCPITLSGHVIVFALACVSILYRLFHHFDGLCS